MIDYLHISKFQELQSSGLEEIMSKNIKGFFSGMMGTTITSYFLKNYFKIPQLTKEEKIGISTFTAVSFTLFVDYRILIGIFAGCYLGFAISELINKKITIESFE
ncbi:MAG: hypothetical protein AABX16_00800 [Nanoarchaeota archaeon]